MPSSNRPPALAHAIAALRKAEAELPTEANGAAVLAELHAWSKADAARR